ncbi:VanZ like family protein [Psychrobacillus sp. OK028]|uniref:VanZ family protein n=1 Tax=Psychrobacillus sp. OK028 TaxID=1884359 RepID=UPI000883876C|nr:VanZ family protein [Psychrobacillus sp. OK028]SDN46233.1 VanZ like family protein [Psychrobacillus sp. OK028]
MKKLIPLLLLLVVVFLASGQTAEQQSLQEILKAWLPNKPLESFLSLIQIPYWGIAVSVEERGYYAFVEFLIRKGTHFIYFGIIALAIYIALPRFKYRKVTVVVIIMLLAGADEYHQSFTSGRTASFQDVMLDTSGAIAALLLVTLAQWLKHRKNVNQ